MVHLSVDLRYASKEMPPRSRFLNDSHDEKHKKLNSTLDQISTVTFPNEWYVNTTINRHVMVIINLNALRRGRVCYRRRMSRLSKYVRQRIIVLSTEKGLSNIEIKKELASESNKVSTSAIYRLIRGIRRQIHTQIKKGLEDLHALLDDEDKKKIDNWLREDDELSAVELQRLLYKSNGKSISKTTMLRTMKNELQWVSSTPRYCQMIRETNKEKRLKFCEEALSKKDTFDDVVFTDESSIQLNRYYTRCRYKKGTSRPLKPKPKHPLKVHVLAGISKEGPTNTVIFTGNMDADFYISITMESALLPFLRRHPGITRFQQDNDPKHTSRKAACRYDV